MFCAKIFFRGWGEKIIKRGDGQNNKHNDDNNNNNNNPTSSHNSVLIKLLTEVLSADYNSHTSNSIDRRVAGLMLTRYKY